MAKGKKFESMIKDAANELGLFYLRLQDSMKFIRSEEARFVPRSPFDGLLYMEGKLFCLELKNIEGTSLSVGDDKVIKTHQIEELTKAAKHEGVQAGFLILFEERILKRTHRKETLIYIPIQSFHELWNSNPEKKSISYDECLQYGVAIEKVNVNVRKMRYNLKTLISC